MNRVRITAVRQTVYDDLMAQYENPIEHACDISVGQHWLSVDAQRPEGLCPSAWDVMRPFVESPRQLLPRSYTLRTIGQHSKDDHSMVQGR